MLYLRYRPSSLVYTSVDGERWWGHPHELQRLLRHAPAEPQGTSLHTPPFLLYSRRTGQLSLSYLTQTNAHLRNNRFRVEENGASEKARHLEPEVWARVDGSLS